MLGVVPLLLSSDSLSILAGVKYTPFTTARFCPLFLSELVLYCRSPRCDPAMLPSSAQFLLNLFMFSEVLHRKHASTCEIS